MTQAPGRVVSVIGAMSFPDAAAYSGCKNGRPTLASATEEAKESPPTNLAASPGEIKSASSMALTLVKNFSLHQR